MNYSYAGTYTKTYYDWRTYKYCNGSEKTLTKYCSQRSYGNNSFTDTLTELEPEDDAAYVNWGPNWRMPTYAQFEELFNSSNTTIVRVTQNGVRGNLITSRTNGNSIFLPAAGSRSYNVVSNLDAYGYYWSRTLYTDYPNSAIFDQVYSDHVTPGNAYRFFGRSVRPVRAQ